MRPAQKAPENHGFGISKTRGDQFGYATSMRPAQKAPENQACPSNDKTIDFPDFNEAGAKSAGKTTVITDRSGGFESCYFNEAGAKSAGKTQP